MNQMAAEIKKTLPNVYTKEWIEILFRWPFKKRQFLIDSIIRDTKKCV